MRNPKASIEKLTREAEAAGYKVHEYAPFEHYCGSVEIHLDIDGHGELFEAYFSRDDETRYWRWHGGFRHVGVQGDRYPTLKAFRELVFSPSVVNPEENS